MTEKAELRKLAEEAPTGEWVIGEQENWDELETTDGARLAMIGVKCVSNYIAAANPATIIGLLDEIVELSCYKALATEQHKEIERLEKQDVETNRKVNELHKCLIHDGNILGEYQEKIEAMKCCGNCKLWNGARNESLKMGGCPSSNRMHVCDKWQEVER